MTVETITPEKEARVAQVESQIVALQRISGSETRASFRQASEVTGIPYATLKNASRLGKVNEYKKKLVIDDALSEYLVGWQPRKQRTSVETSTGRVDLDLPEIPIASITMSERLAEERLAALTRAEIMEEAERVAKSSVYAHGQAEPDTNPTETPAQMLLDELITSVDKAESDLLWVKSQVATLREIVNSDAERLKRISEAING